MIPPRGGKQISEVVRLVPDPIWNAYYAAAPAGAFVAEGKVGSGAGTPVKFGINKR